jgi:hypothetical protein
MERRAIDEVSTEIRENMLGINLSIRAATMQKPRP